MRPPSAGLLLIALVAALLLAPATSTYWDAFGYLTQAVRGDVGGLGFGRPVFVIGAHVVARAWLAGGGSPWLVEPVLRFVVLVVSAAAAPLTWRLARACDLDAQTAWLAALAVACSPAMAHTSTQVLTDGPAVTCLLLAFVWGTRAARGPTTASRANAALLSGAALGLAIGVREQSATGAVTLALLAWAAPSGQRVRLVAMMAAGCAMVVAVPMAWVLATQPAYAATVRAWLVGLGADRSAKTFSARDLLVYAGWVLSLGPFVVMAAARAWCSRPTALWRPRTARLAIVAPALLQMAGAVALRGVGYSPRFLLASLPAAVAIPGALALRPWLDRAAGWRVAVTGLIVLPIVAAAPFVRARQAGLEQALRVWPAMVRSVPDGGVIVSGQPCPAVPFIQALAARDRSRPAPAPAWDAVCPGWAWPRDLTARLDAALDAGQVVAIDLRAAAWIGEEQQAARVEAARYAAARVSIATGGRLVVWR